MKAVLDTGSTSLSETIRLMLEIDAVIEAHGGWPGAFARSTGEEA